MKPRPRLTPELRERLYRRRYIIPNAVTLANMFCGFLVVIYATSGRLQQAALTIGLAILLDGLDGRVARRLNATSKFGVELDSFSDLVSFGIAPAILMYNWCFRIPADEFGVMMCFLYAVCAASRLARFNITEPTLSGFTGMPTPGAAGMVAGLVNLIPEATTSWIGVFLGTLLLGALSFLMVSKIEFLSVKKLRVGHLRLAIRLRMGWLLLLLAGLIALIWYNSRVGLAVLATLYTLSGPVTAILKRRSEQRTATVSAT